jgi:hypothetical protein
VGEMNHTQYKLGMVVLEKIALRIQKADASNEGIQLKASDITEGFVLGHNFSNSSASLFKVKDSGV